VWASPALEAEKTANSGRLVRYFLVEANQRLCRKGAREPKAWADFLEQTQRGGKVLPFRGSAA